MYSWQRYDYDSAALNIQMWSENERTGEEDESMPFKPINICLDEFQRRSTPIEPIKVRAKWRKTQRIATFMQTNGICV